MEEQEKKTIFDRSLDRIVQITTGIELTQEIQHILPRITDAIIKSSEAEDLQIEALKQGQIIQDALQALLLLQNSSLEKQKSSRKQVSVATGKLAEVGVVSEDILYEARNLQTILGNMKVFIQGDDSVSRYVLENVEGPVLLKALRKMSDEDFERIQKLIYKEVKKRRG